MLPKIIHEIEQVLEELKSLTAEGVKHNKAKCLRTRNRLNSIKHMITPAKKDLTELDRK